MLVTMLVTANSCICECDGSSACDYVSIGLMWGSDGVCYMFSYYASYYASECEYWAGVVLTLGNAAAVAAAAAMAASATTGASSLHPSSLYGSYSAPYLDNGNYHHLKSRFSYLTLLATTIVILTATAALHLAL